ncbi:unnamed protein product [Larinioides sclopetarius]|uniref:Uncharacterized protein n=1 Tax=Larinioides sclopetarius TaxID=280406 RepID=A0AAV2A049_9ARAC
MHLLPDSEKLDIIWNKLFEEIALVKIFYTFATFLRLLSKRFIKFTKK